MSHTLDATLQHRSRGITDKWESFVSKVTQRIESVVAEAEAGFAQLIAQHPTDAGPLGNAINAVRSRFSGMDSKVQDAWEKISEEFEEIQDDDDVGAKDFMALSNIYSAINSDYEQLRDNIEMTYQSLETETQAKWATRLKHLASEEAAKTIECTQCRAELSVDVYWQASNQSCASCGATNTVHPGVATGLFYAGQGVHALSHKGAFDAWMAMQRGEKRFNNFRNPTEQDFQDYLSSARDYWTRYYRITSELHPGADKKIDDAVTARMTHFEQWDRSVDKQSRAFFQRLVDAGKNGDEATLRAIASDVPHFTDIDECCACLMEHGDVNGATVLLHLKYEVDDEGEDRDEWLKEQLSDLRNR